MPRESFENLWADTPALLLLPLAVREQWACSYVVFLDDFGLTASTTVEVRHAHWWCWC